MSAMSKDGSFLGPSFQSESSPKQMGSEMDSSIITSGTSLTEVSPSYYGETSGEKFLRKSKESPFMVAGICGGLLTVAYAALKYKNRGGMSTSLYLIHTRIAAQGAVVSAATVGIIYAMLRDHVFNSDKKINK